MKIRTSIRATALAAAVVYAAGSAFAFVPWSNPSGSATYFDWANGGSRNGLFGSPTLVGGDTFVFFPSNYRAQAVNGQTVEVEDRLEFDLFVHTGYKLTGIQISEYGDYGVLGNGSYVSDNGGLFLTNTQNFAVASGQITTNPGSPITTQGFGNWNGTASVTIDPNQGDWTQIHFVLDNNLTAFAADGGLAYIEKKVFGSGIIITLVPAPGSMALAGMGGLLALRRRR